MSEPLELELQGVLGCPVWMLGMEPGSLARAASAPQPPPASYRTRNHLCFHWAGPLVLVKKMPHSLASRSVWWRYFLSLSHFGDGMEMEVSRTLAVLELTI